MTSRRRKGQAIVEFGIIALLFTLLMFAIVDFGLLLNDWLSISAGTRTLARDASVGLFQTKLNQEAQAMSFPGISADSPKFSGPCCTPSSAVIVNVSFYDASCPPYGTGCTPVLVSTLDKRWGQPIGGCTTGPVTPPQVTTCAHPQLGDAVVVSVIGAGAQVITPLVRPFFNGPDCLSTAAHCYVALSDTVIMRYEGNQFP